MPGNFFLLLYFYFFISLPSPKSQTADKIACNKLVLFVSQTITNLMSQLCFRYKLLLVVLGKVDIYVTTKTYKWDTCAGKAFTN